MPTYTANTSFFNFYFTFVNKNYSLVLVSAPLRLIKSFVKGIKIIFREK